MVLQLALGGVAAWLFLLLIASAATQPLDFDGAMNLEVARSLAEGNGPRRLYDFGRLFAPEIQTKEPYILLGAIIFKLFGVGHFQAHLPNLVYLAAFCCVAWFCLRAVSNVTAALLAIVMVLALPSMPHFGLNGYGEVPTFVFGFAALLAIADDRFSPERLASRCAAAGILIGLTIATKSVGIVFAGGVGVVILLRLVSDPAYTKRHYAVAISSFVTGIAVPLLCVEAWRLSWFGRSAYVQWWDYQLSAILYQAGLSASTDGNSTQVFEKIHAHYQLLASQLKLGSTATAMLLIVPLIAGMVTIWRPAGRERWIVIGLLLTAVVYVVWWLAITPTDKAWLRRFYIGMLCLGAVSGIALATSIQKLASGSGYARRFAYAALSLSIVATFFPIVRNSVATPLSFERSASVDAVLQASEVVSGLGPDAMVFGYGWYSAPNIALFSGRGFVDLTDWPIGLLQRKRSYLVADRSTFVVGVLDRVLARYPHRELLPENEVAQVYEMDFGNPANPFAGDSIDGVKTSVTFSDGDYAFTYGMEPYDPIGGRFIQTDSEILLKYEGQKSFRITAYMDASEPSYYLWPGELGGEVLLGDCQPLHFTFDTPGWRDFSMPLADCALEPGQPVRVRILLDNVFDWSTVFHVQRALLLSSVGFSDDV